jgi:hypothetical protein
MGSKIGRKLAELELLEGGGGGGTGGGGRSSWVGNNPKPAKSKQSQDQKEFQDREPELSGKMRFKSPDKYEAFDFGNRTPLTSDDYAKGGSVNSASKRADGIAHKGKTRGVMR